MVLNLTNCDKLKSLVQANGRKTLDESVMSLEERVDGSVEVIQPTQP